MFSTEKFDQLSFQFQRILSLPVSRSTFRELQNTVLAFTKGDVNQANTLMEGLLLNKVSTQNFEMEEFIKKYSVPTRVAKEVQDRGEVLSMLTTDIGVQSENMLFSSRIRRVDGGEFHFITDIESSFQVIEHLLARLNDAKENPIGKETLKKYGSAINRLENLASNLKK